MINNPVRKQLPTLENPGTAIDLRSGKSLIAPDGSVVTGTVPDVEQATPSISVSSGGLITASATQGGGIVADGTKSATQQLTTQGAATITPGTTAKTTVAAGRYTTGDVKVAGDANLVPENIAEGVSIFGVQGTHSGGGGGGTCTVTNNTFFAVYGVTKSENGLCPCSISRGAGSVQTNSVAVYLNGSSPANITGSYEALGFVEFAGSYYPGYLILGDVIFNSADM